MAMGSTAPSPLINGDGALDQETRRYADFYAQILHLRDEVIAGKHPRLKVPASVIEMTTQQPAYAQPPTAARPASNGKMNGIPSPAHSYTPQYSSSYVPLPSVNTPRSSSSQRPLSSMPSSSGIDPVLLTKSDDLVRAEIQLKRQRIERVLKDQVDQKRSRDNGVDTDARFNVSDILAKAWGMVEPISGLRSETNRNSPASDSFDENSYYSSQANSWSSEDPQTAAGADAADTAAPKGNGHPADAANKTVRNGAGDDSQGDLEEGEESDYEPPGAEEFTIAVRTEDNTPQSIHAPQSATNGPARAQLDSAHGSLPSPAVPVITSHIGTPVAPQPSRVSPLTFAKVPGLDAPQGPGESSHVAAGLSTLRNGKNRGNEQVMHAQPKGKGPSPTEKPSKKRKKEARQAERAAERAQRQKRKQRAAASPEAEPRIKEEPVSPPPLESAPEPVESRRKVARPVGDDVEMIAPREARQRPVYYMEYEEPELGPRYADEAEFIRVPSRAAYRAAGRDDQDLRRVASLQYARRPFSPYSAGVYEARSLRGIPHYMESPTSPMYREGSVRAAPTRYIRSERSLSPPFVADAYQARPRSPGLMAPPPVPRRVVVDQYGNRFYAEAPAATPRASMAPPARRLMEEPMYERGPTREPTLRPAPRVGEAFEDEEGLARVPTAQRRYVAEPEVELVDGQRAYRQRDYSMRPVEPAASREEMAPPGREYVERRAAVRYEEMAPPPPREYITRPYSVRPEAVRREGEYMARHGSVVPGGEYGRRPEGVGQGYRAVSVMGDVPVDERRYAYAPQHGGRRYVDEQELIERPVSVVQDPYRMAYRY
ncbi:hypothetical protein K490DRAFT_55161 [Saccharata proteae CBS 121410]|uniref:Uncharacterized protein n=1 Tax=Saccharata proteae CBS 121410 TaxID=1314787 RepID=A0A6A5YCY0_9PEZI|nr:hypothetical protein K490DRAFT_55161 [Saccharata proteae CBS 121410]